MTGERRALAPSFLASIGIHLGLLAVIGALWVPAVQRTFDHVIPVRLLPVAGDGQAGSAAGPKATPHAETPRREPPPPPAARAPVTRPSPPRETAPADRPVEPERRAPEPVASAPEPDAGSKAAGPAPALSLSAPPDPGSASGDARGVASTLGAGTGGTIGPPGYRVNPKPDYPPQAREKGYEGTVVLRVRVLPDGTAGEIVVERSSGHEILDGAAQQAVKAWLFAPATRNGNPVPAWISVPIRFSLTS